MSEASPSSYSLQATWVGGGFILGVAEAVYTPKMGLIWALMPVQYSMSFIFGKKAHTVQQTVGAFRISRAVRQKVLIYS